MVGLREWEDDRPMQRCDACAGYMREAAPRCPHCGHRFRSGQNGTSILTLSFGLTITLAALIFCLLQQWPSG